MNCCARRKAEGFSYTEGCEQAGKPILVSGFLVVSRTCLKRVHFLSLTASRFHIYTDDDLKHKFYNDWSDAYGAIDKYCNANV
ncbi:hypothetical protein JCM16418A_18590 [Paenibacillus pini]